RAWRRAGTSHDRSRHTSSTPAARESSRPASAPPWSGSLRRSPPPRTRTSGSARPCRSRGPPAPPPAPAPRSPASRHVPPAPPSPSSSPRPRSARSTVPSIPPARPPARRGSCYRPPRYPPRRGPAAKSQPPVETGRVSPRSDNPCAHPGRTIPLTVAVTGPWLIQGAPFQPLALLVVRGIDRGRGVTRRQRDPQFFLVTLDLVQE